MMNIPAVFWLVPVASLVALGMAWLWCSAPSLPSWPMA